MEVNLHSPGAKTGELISESIIFSRSVHIFKGNFPSRVIKYLLKSGLYYKLTKGYFHIMGYNWIKHKFPISSSLRFFLKIIQLLLLRCSLFPSLLQWRVSRLKKKVELISTLWLSLYFWFLHMLDVTCT